MSDITMAGKNTFPTYEEKIRDIQTRLINDFKLGMLLIDTTNLRGIEEEHGKSYYDEIINSIKIVIFTLREKNRLRQDDIITLSSYDGDLFYIFLSKQRKKREFQVSAFERLSERLEDYINQQLFPILYPVIKTKPRISMGYAITFHNPSLKETRLLQSLISDAAQMAKYQDIKKKMILKESVYKLIIDKKINIVYQPIINLFTQEIIGYKAFSHGPEGTEYENPVILFNIAREIGLLYELDWVCKMHTFNEAQNFQPGFKLFVNIFSSSITNSKTRLQCMTDLLAETRLQSHDVIFEICDRLALENFPFLNDVIELFHGNVNFAIKIDDTWLISDLILIKKLKIRFIKLDKSLVRNIHNNTINRETVLSLKKLAQRMQVEVIAEGIENKEELKTLVEAGIKVGQGYLFTAPGKTHPIAVLTEIYIQENSLKKILLAAIYNKRAMDYFNRGMYDQAILEFTKALEINPVDIDILYYLACAYSEEGSFNYALQKLNEVIKLDPEYTMAYFTKGLIFEKQHDFDNAKYAFTRYIEIAPPVYQTTIDLARKKLKKLTTR